MCIVIDRRCTSCEKSKLVSVALIDRPATPITYLRRLSHLTTSWSGAPSEMLADPELQALAHGAEFFLQRCSILFKPSQQALALRTPALQGPR